MQNAADHPTIIGSFLAANVRRQKRLDLFPLLIGQPKQVASHDPVPRVQRTESKESLTDSQLNRFIEF
jgi:hypothetical protein